MIIKARTVYNDSTYRIADTLDIKVPGLDLLPTNVQHYNKIGGTCNHHGPSDNDTVNDTCKTEDHNHWATASTRENIDSIAVQWHRQMPNLSILEINDMSLEYDGWFDNGLWTGGTHVSHSTGRDVDVRTNERNGLQRIPLGNINIGLLDERRANLDFEDICQRNGATQAEVHKENRPEEHYHLDF